MKAVGFAGFSGAGKTTIVERVVGLLRAQGHSVSVIKHAHSSFDVDRPGKDSYRHREAGAYEVLLASPTRMAILREWQRSDEPEVPELLAEMQPVDWVLIEGFKHAKLPKIEVWRAATQQPVHCLEDEHVVAIATDSPDELPKDVKLPVINLNQAEDIVNYLLTHAQRFEWRGQEAV